MSDLLTRLQSLAEPIPFVLIGTGSAGVGTFYQSLITPGFRCLGLADIRVERAIEAARRFEVPCQVVETAAGLEDAVRSGRMAVCADGALLAGCEKASVVVDASTALAEAVRFDAEALDRGKHLVMVNSEADLLFGPSFLERARRRGRVYTSCDGDQQTVIKRLIDEIRFWGFRPVMAGNIKGFLNRSADPRNIVPEAEKRGLDNKMCASYTDGTKLAVEMALVANALDMRTPVPGMLGPRLDRLRDVFERYDFPALDSGGPGVVDYVLGPEPKGGIFVIGYNDHPYQKSMLGWFPSNLGPGPYYLFQRPYHLIHIESLRTVAEAFLDGTTLLAPDHGFRTQVYAYAKRDLARGETLDGIGGFACYGLIENCVERDSGAGLPIGLAEGVRLKRDRRRDEKILRDDVEIDEKRPDFAAFAEAEAASGRLQSRPR